MAYIKCNLLLVIAVLTALMVYLCNYTTKTPVEPAKEPRGNINDIYRCCENRCFLLKSLIDQSPVKEVTHKELYTEYNDGTIIFQSRLCGWDSDLYKIN